MFIEYGTLIAVIHIRGRSSQGLFEKGGNFILDLQYNIQYLFLGNLSRRDRKMSTISPVYQPRKPQSSQYYQCVEDNFETLEQVYDDRFAAKFGFFRPYVRQVIYRFLDCGILHNGFARVRCKDCGQ